MSTEEILCKQFGISETLEEKKQKKYLHPFFTLKMHL
ncbi:MAG: hypothetical protein K0Q47_1532 [Sedimentibacter sp.]|nr:hypothetical protein [Sedimentibacter sp.]